MNNTERAVQISEPQQRAAGAVIEAQFPGEAGGQREQQVPILIRFLTKRGRIWKACKRNWDWRMPPAPRDDLALTH
ncbi:MAG TPA: hypothetical protein VFC07_08040 [Verrucomicrobiae bacterium]|nr:hypothetical protein [Verrucomicrobiae bacterium]